MEQKIKEELELLSKDLYLESPDLWIEFSDKINDGVFDELVLFMATKYNRVSIVKYAVKNDLIDLNLKSKNKDFTNIYEHLYYLSKQSKNKDVYNFLDSLKNPSKNNPSTKDNSKKNNLPSVVCPKCKSNIFESGYIICENKVFKFSSKENKPVEVSNTKLNSVVCNNCNCTIPNVTPEKLETLCNVSICSNCLKDLRNVGISDNTSLVYNTNHNKFVAKNNNYSCQNCNHILNKEQEEYFNLRK